MKFVLILTVSVLCIAGVCAATVSSEENSIDPPTVKERIRAALTSKLPIITPHEIAAVCPRRLTSEENDFGNQKLQEFIQCGNATIDKFINLLDDNATYNEPENIGQLIQLYSVPACKVTKNLFKCIVDVGPVIDMCLSGEDKVIKDKLFALLPLMREDVCIHTGNRIADIILHADGVRCVTGAVDTLNHIQFVEMFESKSTVMFGDEQVCQKANNVLKDIYVKVGECSGDVLVTVKEMLGYICERTPCVQNFPNLQCY